MLNMHRAIKRYEKRGRVAKTLSAKQQTSENPKTGYMFPVNKIS